MITWVVNNLRLTLYGPIHVCTQEEYKGLDALLHSAFAHDWLLQLGVMGYLNPLRRELNPGKGYALSDGF